MTRRSASMLCALWLAAASPLTFSAAAAPESARTPAGLEAAEARKLDPILWRALAAADVASRGSAPAGEALWLALTPGAGTSAAGPVVDLLVRMQDVATPAAAQVLLAHDLVPDAVLGSIVTLSRVPLAKVADLARDPAIAHLQPPRTYHTMNDVSVPETGAHQVWTKHGYTGQGVLVAIIDTGIDPRHPDFRHANGTTRIRYLLDLAQAGGGPLGGTLFTASQINQAIQLSPPQSVTIDPVGHGTHVAGTAAGNGSADLAFSGMAPEADLIIVNASRAGNGSFSSTDIVNSLAFVDAQAAALEMPYVANLSLGGHDGAHDGTALEEVAIDNLIGEGKEGKAVVIAAGNDRSGVARHAQAIVNEGGLNLRLNVPDYPPQPGTGNDYAVVHVWYEASSDFRITFTSPTGHSFGSFNPNEWNGENGENTNQGLVGVANALGGVSSENGDREAQFIIIDGGTPPAEGNWQIRFDGDTGPIDAYVAQSTFGAEFLDYTTPGGFVAEPGTARNAITVGAYITKNAWTDKDGNPHVLGITVGTLASFSNAGPTRDGRLKPEIAAPGQEIGSTYTPDAPPSSPVSAYQTPFPQFPNFFLLPGDQYAIQQGTSQATPHVTGAVALLLQQNPDWDQLDLRRALTGSARADAFTGTVPNQGFGYGKLDVLAAVVGAKTPGLPPDGDVSGDLDVDLEDIQLTIGFVLGNTTPTVDEEARADMNRDHLLNVGDVVLIVRASLAGGLAGAPAPANDHGTAPWLVPVTVVPDVKGAHVSGLDLTLAAGSASIAGNVRPGADGILALDAPRPDGGRRVIALATDGSDLAQRTAFLVPVATESAALALRQIELIAPSGKSVPGTIRLGAPLPPAAPQRLAIATLRPEPGRGVRTIVVDVPSSIAGGPAGSAAAAATPVTVAIYDTNGRHVRTLTRNPLAPGRHELVWDGRGARGPVAAGVYWVRLAMGSEIVSARLTVLK